MLLLGCEKLLLDKHSISEGVMDWEIMMKGLVPLDSSSLNINNDLMKSARKENSPIY